MSKPYLAIAAIVKNEAPYIEEWIAFHQAVGVEHFYLYDNGSDDGTSDRVEYMPDVTVYDWPGEKQQLYAYANALMHHDAQWLAFLDADEFLFSPSYVPLPSFLRDFEHYDAVAACWALFGTSDIASQSDNVLRTYTKRAVQDYGENRHVKSIVQPRRVHQQVPLDPHHFQCRTVDALGRVVTGPLADTVTWHGLRVNHYRSKSIEEAEAKLQRPRADNGQLRSIDLMAPELNAESDTCIMPYASLAAGRLSFVY